MTDLITPSQNLAQKLEINEFFFHPHDSICPHSSVWGDFNFSLNGILEIQVGERTFLAPPNYGLWLPPQTSHFCIAVEQPTHFICIRVHPELCAYFNTSPKTLEIRPFFHALVKELLHHQSQPDLAEYQHLLQVLLDQMLAADCYDHYLPQTTNPILAPILDQLGQRQSFDQSLQQILENFQISERHALRLSQQELHLSLSEWRNRAKIVYAIGQIQQGSAIKRIALDLGYQHSSSFIEFFKRYTGQTPLQMK
ncbi:AraC family transcriptional regulator [Acinetobacter sp. S40]|uniref:AraC family transcriptional regulator n=1 Tax=Acinetobacter sp. S40 TaxID=2767434 RepID=UPI0019095729|nr:AraC family transcriptional regulator [Acinetobacter sp. S40]MBJ9986907.1 AraC family transcriptional regulator [Acinetobacter sp. S40]